MLLSLVAACAVILLVASEIVAIAPGPQAGRQRRLWLGAALPLLILFAAGWIWELRSILAVTP